MRFSLLLPVWQGDDPSFLRRAISSSVMEQSRRPAEVVVVRDGPVGQELGEVLAAFRKESPVPVVLVELAENVGLGQALDVGLSRCSNDVVARMDADDISLPHRFERQLPLVEAGMDLVGAGLIEIGSDEHDVLGVRVPPTDDETIRRSSRFADPFNHPTVVYRRSAVSAAGGYQGLNLLEDYWLFARMIAAGAAVANVAEPLVMYRVGAGAYERRGGKELWTSEMELQRRFYAAGFTTRGQYWRNVAVRGGYRFTPVWLRRVAYRAFLADRGTMNGAAADQNVT